MRTRIRYNMADRKRLALKYITILIFSCKLAVTAGGQSSRGTGRDRIVEIDRLTEVPAKDNLGLELQR